MLSLLLQLHSPLAFQEKHIELFPPLAETPDIIDVQTWWGKLYIVSLPRQRRQRASSNLAGDNSSMSESNPESSDDFSETDSHYGEPMTHSDM